MISRNSVEYLVGKSSAVACFNPLWRKSGHLVFVNHIQSATGCKPVTGPLILYGRERLPKSAKFREQAAQAEHVRLRVVRLATKNLLQKPSLPTE